MPTDLSLGMSSFERSKYGVIVTLREQETREQRVHHLRGRVYEELETLAAELDLARDAGADWRVCSISTPATIYRDLQGGRGLAGKQRFSQDGDPILTLDFDPLYVERAYMGHIGRVDLLEPRARTLDASSRELPLARRQQSRENGSGGGE